MNIQMLKIQYFILLALLLIGFTPMKSQVIYNGYANVTNITGNVLTVNNVNEANHTFAINEQVIVMQMQDNVIGSNTSNLISFGDLAAIQSAGLYEVAQIQSLTRTSGVLQTVTFTAALGHGFNIGPNSSVQIITFRSLSATAFTSVSNITGLAWNGFVGGVIALKVGTVFTLGHNISANAIGFRGGTKNVPNFASTSCESAFINAIGNKWAGKGEGIYKNTNTNFDGGRAKILTGGGGGTDENSGGGGGGNFSVGGTGGPGYTGAAAGCNPSMGALGGITVSTSISGSRVFMGGGGGAGHENNSVGTAGGNGGGIILIKTGTLTTTGSCVTGISANGATPPDAGNDGSGGGGAGGSVVLDVTSFNVVNTCPLVVSANAGNGGFANTPTTHSGGGGGSQGVVIYTAAQPNVNMITTTINGIGGCNQSACTSSATPASGASNAGIFSLAFTPLPIELKKFTGTGSGSQSVLKWTTATEKNCSHFEVERTMDGSSYTQIGTVRSKSDDGNSSNVLDYNFTDLNAGQGINYYRLKVVDLDKTSKYSHVVEVNHGQYLQLSDLIVYPNPSNGQFFLHIRNYNSNDLELDVALIDISGRQIEQKKLKLSSSEPIELFNNVTSGYYILKVKNGSQELFVKLIVN